MCGRPSMAWLALRAFSACTPPLSGAFTTSSPALAHVSLYPLPSDGETGAAGCEPPSPTGSFVGEVSGAAARGTVWAWFLQAYPPHAVVEDKTVWRLDGPNVPERHSSH